MSEPFHVAPRRRDFYPAASPPPGMAALSGNDGGRVRLITITGEPGTGRTSALRRLAAELRSDGWLVFVFETATAPHPEHLSHDDILRAACRTFGLHQGLYGSEAEAEAEAGADDDAANAGLGVLRERAFAEPPQAPIAIVVDDAGRLADAALAGVLRLIAPPCASDQPRAPAGLGLILGGTPVLLDRLAAAAPDLVRHLDGAVNVADVRLHTLAREDVAAYVEHCLTAAGFQGGELFDATAIECLAAKSNGNLGEINALSAPAMVFAWQASRQLISADLIDGTGIAAMSTRTAATAGVAADDGAALTPSPGTALTLAAPRRQPLRRRRVWIGLGLAGLLLAGIAGTVGRSYIAGGLDAAVAVAASWSGPGGATPGGAATGESISKVSGGTPDSASLLMTAMRPGEANADALVERGEALLRGADAVSARRFFAKAAESGSAAAAAAMAASYDPLYLAENAIRGVEPDPEQAESWYRVAITRGDGAAQERLSALTESRGHL